MRASFSPKLDREKDTMIQKPPTKTSRKLNRNICFHINKSCGNGFQEKVCKRKLIRFYK